MELCTLIYMQSVRISGGDIEIAVEAVDTRSLLDKLKHLSELVQLDLVWITDTIWQEHQDRTSRHYHQLLQQEIEGGRRHSTDHDTNSMAPSIEHVTMMWIRHMLHKGFKAHGLEESKVALDVLSLLLRVHRPLHFVTEFGVIDHFYSHTHICVCVCRRSLVCTYTYRQG